MKLNQIAFALVATLGVVSVTQAALVSDQSYGGETGDGLLKLGTAYTGSTAGGGVDGQLYNLNASFQNHFVSYINNPNYGGSYDSNTGIYSFAGSELAGLPAGAPDHTGLGVWAFKNVSPTTGGDDVWFGEWAKEVGSTGVADASTHTVFYIGNDANTTVPETGTATYTVSGINNGNNLTGTYSADFGEGTLSGTLTGSGTVTSLTINSEFDVGEAEFYGTASATGTSGTDTNGVSSGQFFGANAASLAGIATFVNTRAYDTAFGGVKQ
ncbi:MAG: transferrin-binding protein-like solute binding protein [Acinetobacter populi]|jgi:hypothetical protein|uniref:Slam-dependent surface lipoprotein n=1 Tax=Acinetobacter populi TaxID=1582270 RepID=UPI0023576ED6|nr:Slam-dependent surface lipoprotein [Acinetobacter populi]MCH4248934.1 transferrin-binding protein-like solute binding protein [Acinetobacter populi]